MLAQAQAASHPAKTMFGFAVKAEEVHARLYAKALEAVQRGEDLKGVEVYLCPFCGYIELAKPSAACPICGAKPEKLIQV
jgi:rubrerythrin